MLLIYFGLLFCVICIIILIILQTKTTIQNVEDSEQETLVFLNASTSRTLDIIRDSAAVLGTKPTFVGLIGTTYNSSSAKIYHIGSTTVSTNNNFTTGNGVKTNKSIGYVGGYQELQYLDNYLAANSFIYEITESNILTGNHDDIILYIKLLNKIKNTYLYLFNYTQTFAKGYLSENNNKSTFAAFTKIKEVAGNTNFIVVGNTNIIGWELVSNYVFGNTVYTSGDLRMPTINDDNGLASIDCIIISKKYCKGFDITIEPVPFTFSNSHYLLTVKINHLPNIKPKVKISEKNKKMLNYYINNITDKNFMLPYNPAWDPTKHTTEDQTNYWKEITIATNQKPLVSIESELSA